MGRTLVHRDLVDVRRYSTATRPSCQITLGRLVILSRVIKIVATKCQILRQKMQQVQFWLGLHPRPCSGSLQCSPDPLAGFEGPTSKGKEGRGGEVRLPHSKFLDPPMTYNVSSGTLSYTAHKCDLDNGWEDHPGHWRPMTVSWQECSYSYSYSYGHSSTIQLKADQYGHANRVTCKKKRN